MEVRELTIMVGTDQPEAMARFYGETLGLQRVSKFRDPVFEAAGGFIRILDHSEISWTDRGAGADADQSVR